MITTCCPRISAQDSCMWSTFGQTRWSRPSPMCPASKASPTSPRARRSTPRTGARTRSASSMSLAWRSSRGFRRKPSPTASPTPCHFTQRTCRTSAKAESVIDVRTDTIVKVLRFDSETGVPQYDPISRKIYVNLQDQNILAVIDPVSDAVVGRYPVQGCRENHGMAIDPEHHRAFLSCEGNDTLAVFDLDTHRAIAHLPMAKGADVVMFDPGLGRIYVACSSGAISVFQMDGPGRFRKLQDVPVEPKIHSLAVDRRTHRVYAPAEQEKGRPTSKMFVFEAVTD